MGPGNGRRFRAWRVAGSPVASGGRTRASQSAIARRGREAGSTRLITSSSGRSGPVGHGEAAHLAVVEHDRVDRDDVRMVEPPWACGSRPRSSETLRTTCLPPSERSLARKTRDVPPRPSSETSWNSSNVSPGSGNGGGLRPNAGRLAEEMMILELRDQRFLPPGIALAERVDVDGAAALLDQAEFLVDQAQDPAVGGLELREPHRGSRRPSGV